MKMLTLRLKVNKKGFPCCSEGHTTLAVYQAGLSTKSCGQKGDANAPGTLSQLH